MCKVSLSFEAKVKTGKSQICEMQKVCFTIVEEIIEETVLLYDFLRNKLLFSFSHFKIPVL